MAARCIHGCGNPPVGVCAACNGHVCSTHGARQGQPFECHNCFATVVTGAALLGGGSASASPLAAAIVEEALNAGLSTRSPRALAFRRLRASGYVVPAASGTPELLGPEAAEQDVYRRLEEANDIAAQLLETPLVLFEPVHPTFAAEERAALLGERLPDALWTALDGVADPLDVVLQSADLWLRLDLDARLTVSLGFLIAERSDVTAVGAPFTRAFRYALTAGVPGRSE